MTLEEAIAVLKQTTVYSSGAPFMDIIVNATKSGDLTPKSDHRLAVALAYQKAGEKLHWLWNADGTKTERRVAEESAAAILALADQDALAEVLALKAERDELCQVKAALGVKGGNEHYPTEDAYLLACSAIEKQRARAEAAEAEVARLLEALPKAYELGFASSAEGWNGEHPGNHLNDEDWHKTRAADLAALQETKP